MLAKGKPGIRRTNKHTYTVDTDYHGAGMIAEFILFGIFHNMVPKEVYILDLHGVSAPTFRIICKKMCEQTGQDKNIISKVFRVQAENGKIVFNNNYPKVLFGIGKTIPK